MEGLIMLLIVEEEIMETLTLEQLNEILRLHNLWLEGDKAGVRANLQWTNLKGADLKGADLRRADLQEANLEKTNLDYSCWPLHCGSKNVKLDKELQAQLLGHIVDACKDVQFTEEQLDFVYENWERAEEFLGKHVK